MKKSENDRRSWRGISASRSTNFQIFLSVQFFFIAIRLTICGGGSAPHFAANAILKIIGEFESSISKAVATTKF